MLQTSKTSKLRNKPIKQNDKQSEQPRNRGFSPVSPKYRAVVLRS